MRLRRPLPLGPCLDGSTWSDDASLITTLCNTVVFFGLYYAKRLHVYVFSRCSSWTLHQDLPWALNVTGCSSPITSSTVQCPGLIQRPCPRVCKDPSPGPAFRMLALGPLCNVVTHSRRLTSVPSTRVQLRCSSPDHQYPRSDTTRQSWLRIHLATEASDSGISRIGALRPHTCASYRALCKTNYQSYSHFLPRSPPVTKESIRKLPQQELSSATITTTLPAH